jgi:uncharacterized protein YbcI
MNVKLPFSVLKQEIIKSYNSINQEIFGIGVKSQRLEILGDKVIIFAVHKRIPAIKVLDETNRMLTIQVDRSLMEANKKLLAEQIETIVGIPIIAVLKDYDPLSENSATIIIFKDVLEEYQ